MITNAIASIAIALSVAALFMAVKAYSMLAVFAEYIVLQNSIKTSGNKLETEQKKAETEAKQG